MSHNTPPPDFSAGRFRALTGLTDKALRLYADRGVFIPAEVDPATGYRSYSADQISEGIVLDLLRRAKIPLNDLEANNRLDFDDHRGKIAMRRAMEDFHLDLAERVAHGDPAALTVHESETGPAHWIAADLPLPVSVDTDDIDDVFSALAVDLPQLDQVLLDALHSSRIALVSESWTTSAQGNGDWMRIAHRVATPVSEQIRRHVERNVLARCDATVRVTSGTLPSRHELVYSSPEKAATDDTGLAEMTASYLAIIASTQLTSARGHNLLGETARRRVFSASMFDPSAVPTDVYDILRGLNPPDSRSDSAM